MNELVVEKPRRRTQLERSTETRGALIQAAITTLHKHGYGSTTTGMVAEEAGVSRGAMLHHFGTKVDLMLQVVQFVYDQELSLYRQRFEGITGAREVLLAAPQIIWEVLSRPSGVAVLEILQGSRSDAALAERLLPLQAEIERHSFERTRARTGMDPLVSDAALRLIHWSIRGLSVAQVLAPDPTKIHESVQVLHDCLQAMFDSRPAT